MPTWNWVPAPVGLLRVPKVEDVRVERATAANVPRLDDEERVVPFNANEPPDRQIDFAATGDAVQER